MNPRADLASYLIDAMRGACVIGGFAGFTGFTVGDLSQAIEDGKHGCIEDACYSASLRGLQ